MRPVSFTTQSERPYGRQLGRSLDPLDYREGFPQNGVVLVGAYALDKHDTFAEQKRAAEKALAVAAARRKAKERTDTAKANGTLRAPPPSGGVDGSPAVAVEGEKISLEGAKASVPYMVIAGLITIVVAHFIFKVG